jgi:hypothetical protein
MPKLTTGARGDRTVFEHAPVSPASPAADPRQLVMLERRWRLQRRRRPDFVAIAFNVCTRGRQEIAVARNYAVQLPEERGGFFVG